MRIPPRHFAGIPVVAALVMTCGAVHAQTSAFTYQGKLSDAGTPANGDYEIQFGLANALNGGSVLSTLTKDPVTVSDGVFTVELDYGASAFIGFDRWIEIAVRPSGSTDPFEVLTPRQAVTSAPYAIHAGSVNASSLIGQVTDANLSTTLSVARSFTNPANTFFGDGANLTNLDAGSVASGTLADTVLSPNVALLDANNIFTGYNAIRGSLNFDDGTAGSRFSMRHDGASQTFRIRDSWGAVDLLSVTKNGRVGIGLGDTNPSDLVHLSGTGGTRIRVQASSNNFAGIVGKNDLREIFMGVQGAFDSVPGDWHIYDNTAGAQRMVITSTGNVGIGNPTPGSKLTVDGTVETTTGGVKFPDGTVQTTAATGSSTEYLKLGPGAFASYFGNGQVANNWFSGVHLVGGSANDELIAPIQLPAGARILSMTAYVNDVVVTDLRFQIDRKVNSNTSANGTGIGFTLATGAGFANQTFTPASPHVVNNSQAYFLRVIPMGGNWPLNGNLAVQNVIIEWDRP